MLRKLLLIALVANLAACSTVVAELQRDPRDAAWDPKGGAALFEQIPAWDGAANRVCGGHLPPEQARREGRSMRC
jgi:hypothetical protein